MKIKRHIGVPATLLVYLIAMGIYTWPGRQMGISYVQWCVIVVFTLICIVILYFLLKKREKYRKEKE